MNFKLANSEVLIDSTVSVQQEYCQDGRVISRLALLIPIMEPSIEIKFIAVFSQVSGLTRGVACTMSE